MECDPSHLPFSSCSSPFKKTKCITRSLYSKAIHPIYKQGHLQGPFHISLLVVNTASAMNSHGVATSGSATDALNETQLSYLDHAPQTPFPMLPSYEEATGNRDASRLPSYRQSRMVPRSFHPYPRRPKPAPVDDTGFEHFVVCLPPAFPAI